MRKYSLLLVSLCISPALLGATPERRFSPEQQSVLNVHKAMWQAIGKRDLDAWSSYVVKDCIFSDEDGEITTKADLLGHLRSLPPEYDRSEDHREFLVHVYGDTAVLNFRVTAREQFTQADIVTEMRETETFAKLGGSWKLIAVQWGALPINRRKSTAGDAASMNDYAGEYEWRPKGPVDHVSVKDGRLWSRLSEEAEDHEYLPSGKDSFFLRDDLGETTFVRDADGRVAGYVYHRADGQEIRVKKIK